MTAAQMDIIIGANVDQAIEAFKKLGYNITKIGQQAEKFTKKSSKDFTGLSRIIQDLPYGFNAISNNLTQLLPAAGAAGLAFSAIVSAVTLAQIGFGAWTRGMGESKKALNENTEAIKELQASAGKEIATLTTLTNAAKNTNLSMVERLAAVKKLREEFPSYFKDLQTEQILNGNVATAIQATSKAIFQRALIRQKESELGPIAGKLFDLQQQREELVKQTAALKRLNFEASKTRNRTGVIASLTGAGSNDKRSLAGVAQQIAAIDKELLPLQGQFKGLAQAIIDATEAAGAGVFSDEFIEKVKKSKTEVKDFYTAWKKEMMRLNTQGIVLGSFQQEIEKLVGDQGKLTITPSVKIDPNLDPETVKKFEALASVVSGIVDNFAIGLGETIGNVLSGKGDLFGGFLKLLGDSITSIGKYVIVTSALLAKIRAALTAALAGAPGLGLAVGIGLVALGTALKNIPKFGMGGVVTKPTLLIAGDRGPEKLTPLGYEGAAGNMMQGAVQFVIRGQDLYGTLNRFTQSNRNIN